MLLDHTAGVPEFSETSAFQTGGVRDYLDSELVELVASLPLENEPGAAHDYSNTHYVMLSMIVEGVADGPWQDELDARVLGPANLVDTRAPDGTDGWDADRLATIVTRNSMIGTERDLKAEG